MLPLKNSAAESAAPPAKKPGLIAQAAHFLLQEALSCIFPVSIFLALALTKVVTIPHLPRYDLLLILCLLVQAVMYWTKLESKDELKVIGVFHVFGLALELFKTHVGSWSWPMVSGYLIVGFFIWVAENIATFLGAWTYPNQVHTWRAVHTDKITSWFLLVIISFICVAQLKHVKAKLTEEPDPVARA